MLISGSIHFRELSGDACVLRGPRQQCKKRNIDSTRVEKVLQRKSVEKLNIRTTTFRQILADDLACRSYETIREPTLNDEHRQNRKKFTHCIENNVKKDDTSRWPSSDETLFDIDGSYHSKHDRWWADSRVEPDAAGIAKTKQRSVTDRITIQAWAIPWNLTFSTSRDSVWCTQLELKVVPWFIHTLKYREIVAPLTASIKMHKTASLEVGSKRKWRYSKTW